MQPRCSAADVEHALAQLTLERAVAAHVIAPPTAPGLYAWFADAPGAADLSASIDVPIPVGLIYAGQTGATKWPSGRTGTGTLRTRISGQHVRGHIRGSTFRLTLGAVLRSSLRLEVVAGGRLSPDSETRLSEWIARHLSVVVYVHDDRETLGDLEDCVLQALDPPLNLRGMTRTPVRAAVSRARASLADGRSGPGA